MKPAAILTTLIVVAIMSWAQELPPEAPAPQLQTQQSEQQTVPAFPHKHNGERHRIFHLVPAFDVADPSTPYRPLTARQKYTLMADRVFDRFTVVKAVFGAALGQATGSPHYGQGWDAYGARVGAGIGDTSFHDFLANAFFPSILKQDPRYFPKKTGSGGERLLYAMSRVLVTRQDSGKEFPNLSQWMGTVAASGLSNAYYPEPDRTLNRTMSRAGWSLGTEMGLNVLKEFWPDLKRKLHKKKD